MSTISHTSAVKALGMASSAREFFADVKSLDELNSLRDDFMSALEPFADPMTKHGEISCNAIQKLERYHAEIETEFLE